MSNNEIIEMARQAGASKLVTKGSIELGLTSTDKIIAFAKLVAAKEREQMIKDGWRQCAVGQRTTQFCGQLEQAVEVEREACANLCEDTKQEYKPYTGQLFALNYTCANAIRARSNSKGES